MTNDAITTINPEWQGALCERYAILILEYGRWFLLAALVIGTIGAAVLVFKSLSSGAADGDDQGGGGAPAMVAIVEALKGLVEAFAKAPTWLAMFGGGALLLWMAGNAISSNCAAEAEPTENASNMAADSDRQQENFPGNTTDNSTADTEEAGGGS